MLETQAPVKFSRLRAFSGHSALWPTVLLNSYVAAGIIVTWPLATYLGGRLPDIPGPASYVWSLWWVAHQVTHLSDPWFTPRLAAPAGVQLGYDTLMPALGLLISPSPCWPARPSVTTC
jgi:hypothetical protein